MVQSSSPTTSPSKSGSGSGSDSESWPDGDGEGQFRHCCVSNLKEFLQKHKGMTAAAAKDFISKRISIQVKNASYEDCDEIRSVNVVSEVRAAKKNSSGEVPAITLEYEYHHRTRWSSIEHICKLTYSMPGASGNVFRSHFVDIRGPGDHQIEKRSFTFAQKKAKTLKDTIFGEGWTPLEAMIVCYAAAGVAYHDSTASLSSHANTPVCKGDYIEHHTRKVCKALNNRDGDDGYETEPFSKRYERERQEMMANAPSEDEDGHGYGFADYF